VGIGSGMARSVEAIWTWTKDDMIIWFNGESRSHVGKWIYHGRGRTPESNINDLALAIVESVIAIQKDVPIRPVLTFRKIIPIIQKPNTKIYN
jgi:hypothetical protein